MPLIYNLYSSWPYRTCQEHYIFQYVSILDTSSSDTPRQNFFLQNQYNIKQTSIENLETNIWIRGLLVDPITNHLYWHGKNCIADNKYYWDIGSGSVKPCVIMCTKKLCGLIQLHKYMSLYFFFFFVGIRPNVFILICNANFSPSTTFLLPLLFVFLLVCLFTQTNYYTVNGVLSKLLLSVPILKWFSIEMHFWVSVREMMIFHGARANFKFFLTLRNIF